MALEIDQIDDRVKLREWLNGKPIELSQLIVSRTALRVLPLLVDANKYKRFEKLTFVSFRGNP